MPINPNVPDPGPEPESEKLTNDQVIAKYAPEMDDASTREMILKELVYSRKLTVAQDRKDKAERALYEKWYAAYMDHFGTDEG